jgi:sulfate transport system ATP-binding protein
MDIRIRSLSKVFGRSPALHDTNLDIESGELLALLGPSGSGKTTLLRLIAGLETPSAGQIFFGEEDASHTPVQHRRVGFVFQSYALFRHMTVAENIAYGLRVRPRRERPSGAKINHRVAELLDMMQLGGFGRRYPTQLSGGQRQRVALARALAVEPRVLLLDEPFGALDAQVRKDLRRWLRELHDRTGHTTVFVTHDQDEALELSDRVAILNRGRIEQIGTPDSIYDTPATPFVFGFIGQANRLDVTAEGGRLLCGGRDTHLRQADLPDGKGQLFFRPQHADFCAGPEHATVSGTVSAVRRIGPTCRAEIRVEGQASAVEVDVRDTAPGEGQSIGIRLRQWAVFPAP